MFNPDWMAIILAVMAGALFIVAGIFVWLIRKFLKLRDDYEELAEILHGLNNDVRDLYTTTLVVDERISVTDGQIGALAEKIDNLQPHDSSNHPYSMAIQKVRSGASVSELMQTSGLSQDEAALLIRLHGAKSR